MRKVLRFPKSIWPINEKGNIDGEVKIHYFSGKLRYVWYYKDGIKLPEEEFYTEKGEKI